MGESDSTVPPGDPLLAGAETEPERRGRRRLIKELLAEGVERTVLENAVAEDRLSLLPAELVLSGRRHYTAATLERRSGLSRADFEAYLRASGLPPSGDPSGADIAAAKTVRTLVDAGVPLERVLEVARVAGQALASTARAVVRTVGEVYLRPGDTEYDLGMRYAEVAEELTPLVSRLVDYQLRSHLREALRHETVARAERQSGHARAAREVTVAFADLVGFTRLGTRVHADEVGRVAGRLMELASLVCVAPVTIVKTIGDAVMLVSPEPAPMIHTLLALIDAVDLEGEHFPQLRAGVACGPAVPLGGDWYGHVVNVASRLTEVARPGTVLAANELRHATRDEFHWSRALPRHLRGIPGAVFVAKVRNASDGEDGHPAKVRSVIGHVKRPSRRH